MKVGELVDVTIERLIAGGDGLARHREIILMVSYAVPGDEVRVRVTSVRKGYARGVLEQLLVPSPARRAPRCRHFGECGGCQWQQIEYATQLQWKQEIVRESLRRTGGIEWVKPIPIRAGAEYGYRSRAQWKLAFPHFGYSRAGSHEIVPAQECPVLAPELEALLPRRSTGGPREVEAALGALGVGWDDEEIERHAGGFRLAGPANGFFQANRFLLETLIEETVAGPVVAQACDLYAGVGLFSLPLAGKHGQVVAVESEVRATRYLAQNAQHAGLTNLEVVTERVAAWLQHPPFRPDLVVLDPPRIGAKDAVPGLVSLAPARIVYVSCDPVTLARDLGALVRGGYRLDTVTALDLFPQTHHVETVVSLTRA